jgi:hypothetical protein
VEITMKRIVLATAALAGAAVLVAGCGGSSPTARTGHAASTAAGVDGARAASLVIRHRTQGCHSWSLNGMPFGASQVARLEHGNGITVTDNDVMPQRLVQVSGPAAAIAGAETAKPGARSTVVFPTPGVYKFTTKAGEDYTQGIVTTGPDNVLALTVYVS